MYATYVLYPTARVAFRTIHALTASKTILCIITTATYALLPTVRPASKITFVLLVPLTMYPGTAGLLVDAQIAALI